MREIGFTDVFPEWNLIVLQVNEYIFTNGKRNKRILRQYDDNCRRIHNEFIDKLL